MPNFRGETAWRVSDKNQSLVEDFLSGRQLGSTSQTFYDAIRSWDKFTNGVSLEDATRDDVRIWYNVVKDRYKAGTIDLNGQKLRILYDFKHGREEANKAFAPIPFKDLRRVSKKGKQMKDNVISKVELMAIVKEARHPRSQAFYTVLYESGCRKGEILGLKIRDIQFGEQYSIIHVSGKTGERTLALVDSVPFLRSWLQVHPDRTPEQYVFVTNKLGKLKQMSEETTITTLRNCCKRAGIRMIHPHQLRHTRLTELAESGIPEFDLKEVAGWTPSSTMAATYLHFTGKTTVPAMLKTRGVEVKVEHQAPERKLASGYCPKCDGVVSDLMVHCPNCGYVLDPALRMIEDKREKDFVQKPLLDAIEDMQNKMEEMRAEMDRMREASDEAQKEEIRNFSAKEIKEAIENTRKARLAKK